MKNLSIVIPISFVFGYAALVWRWVYEEMMIRSFGGIRRTYPFDALFSRPFLYVWGIPTFIFLVIWGGIFWW